MAARSEPVHIVTILYRSEAALPGFLDSLQAQDLPDWRLWVVDNASPDRSRDLVAARADVRVTVLANPVNLGFARAANQGLRAAAAAGGEFFLLINNDTVFAPDFLGRLVGLRDRLKAGVIAPRIMRFDRPEVAWYAGGRLSYGTVFVNLHDPYDPKASRAPTRVDFASGCCLGLARTVLEQVGLFDESFFLYWEDTDFCMRLNARGIPITYVPELSMLHAAGSSSGGEFSAGYLRQYYRSYAQFLRKHFGKRQPLRTLACLWWRGLARPLRYRQLVIATAAMLHGMRAPMGEEPRLDRPASGEIAPLNRDPPSDRAPSAGPSR